MNWGGGYSLIWAILVYVAILVINRVSIFAL